MHFGGSRHAKAEMWSFYRARSGILDVLSRLGREEWLDLQYEGQISPGNTDPVVTCRHLIPLRCRREEYVITVEDTELVFHIEDNGGLCAEENQMENLAQLQPGDNV
ncbi:uncharacterized protein BJ212DRAFT_1304160 [Suillus subaureus]|uniref:Uncharacterized protein n=1 Tax=Suillus subaureus TaxID=48587 RepID=A0A9P7J6N1_9AGAM|nr:uncharacterized protein BJ212DRAFT_1304160 [Suillus subaureus]KAG1805202.1 hypothetical protein BJ212DRAFT_1304160 [Suillus subaureus]